MDDQDSSPPEKADVDSPVAATAGHRRFPQFRLPTKRGLIAWLAGPAVGLAVLVAYAQGGVADGLRDTFVVMGFDPDRGILLAAIVGAALTATAVVLVGGRNRGWWQPSIAGLVGLVFVFGPTFRHETRLSRQATGSAGTFDPGGWVLSTVTLLVVGLVVGWAAGLIAGEVRRIVLVAVGDARSMLGSRRLKPLTAIRAVGVPIALVAVAVAFVVLADMLNFTPDTLMRRGSAPGVGLDTSNPFDLPLGSPSPSSATGGGIVTAEGLVPGPFRDSLVSRQGWSDKQPWVDWRPTGRSRLQDLSFPAPFVNKTNAQVPATVYLPAGYGLSQRRYPVTYFVPWPKRQWARGAAAIEQLDSLIAAAAIPAQIAVFATLDGSGPYPDSQCADSADGQAWWDRYLVQTLVPAIDTRYRTLGTAATRAILGTSQGGFCATAVVARHPDVFGLGVGISGYYDAAPRSNQTVNAAKVFNNDPALITAASPTVMVRNASAGLRAKMFFVLAGQPSQAFYGSYFTSFGDELVKLGVPCALLPDKVGHGWTEARVTLGPLLRLLAGRMVALGALSAGL